VGQVHPGEIGHHGNRPNFLKPRVDRASLTVEKAGTDLPSMAEAVLALEKSERRFRTLIEMATDLVAILDAQGGLLYVSPSVESIVGYRPSEVLGRNFLDFVHPEDMQAGADAVAELLRHPEKTLRSEFRYRHKNGSWLTIQASNRNLLDDPTVAGILVAGRDVSEHKAAEERIRVLNVLYATLSGINHAIVQSRTRSEVSRRICDLVVKSGMWHGVWIGFVDGATKRVVPEVWSESMEPYIERMVVSVDPSLPEGQGPTGTSARTGVPYFCNDVFADPATLPWRKFAESFGISTVAAVPLRAGRDFIGVVNLYSVQRDIYTAQVRSLLIELGEDVSFALANFQNEQLRLAAESSLAESEAKFRGLVEQSISGAYVIQDGKFVYANPYFAEIFGYDAAELVGVPFEQLVAEADRERVGGSIRKRLSGEVQSLQYAFAGRRKDGSLIDIGVHGTLASYGGKPAVIGLLQDITERRKAEELAKQYVVQLEKAMFGTIDAVTAMLDLRDPYTSGHQHRVGELAGAIGAELGLSEHEVKGLRVIGRIHDIGKISVPAEILSKPGKLTPIEFEMIKSHSQQGYDILKSVDFPWPVAEAVLQHHERLDSSGYPRGLKGDAISLSARILAVADTVEAMATHRPYRAALGIDAALREIERESGTRYDAKVVDACLRLFRDKGYTLQR
jgi:PAS domain S-box-containing protein